MFQALPKIIFPAICLGLLGTLSACGVSVSGDGPPTVRTRTVAAFDAIEIEGSTRVVVRPGDGHALRLEGGEHRVDALATRVEDGTLVVEQGDSTATLDIGGDTPVRVVAEAPRIDSVRIDGSGSATLPGLDGPALALAVHGSGEVEAGGRVERLRGEVDGSGELHLRALLTTDARVAISGSGEAEVGPAARLDAEVDGSAHVSYLGEPELTEAVSGSGSVEGA